MRNLILFLTLLFSSVSFAQILNDIVNFDSLKINFINTEVIKRINEKRESIHLNLFIKDTIPTFAAQYNLLYFKQHHELSEIHNEKNPVHYDIYGKGYKIYSTYEYPHSRLYMAEKNVNFRGILFSFEDMNYEIIKEKSFSYTIMDNSLTYSQLINVVVEDLLNETDIIVHYNENVYFGMWNEFIRTNNDGITFAITYVTTYNRNNGKKRL